MNAQIQPNRLRPRWRKVWSDLWDDKTRTALVVASIAVGVFAVGTILCTYVILANDINQGFAAVNPPNIEIRTEFFYKDLISVVEKVPGVQGAEGRRLIEIRARRGDENWQTLTLVGMPDSGRKINLLTPLAGTAFPGTHEAVVSRELIHDTGFKVGDRVEIELPDGSSHVLTVVGLVSDQTASKPDVRSTNNVYVTLSTLRSLGVGGAFNTLFVTVDGEGNDSQFISDVAAAVKDKVEDSNRTVQRMEEHLSTEHPMIETVLAMLGVLGALGALVAILSSALIINTLNALLTDQRRQIGVMKLVGGRSYQILGMYLILIVAYGIISLALAAPLAAIAGYAFAWGIASLLGAVIGGFRIIPAAIGAQILMAMLLPLAAGFFPVRAGAKTSVQQAISPSRSGARTGGSNLVQLNARRFRWISRPILLSFRNTFRQRGRLLLTIFTLTVAGAVFIAVFNVRDSMDNLIGQLTKHFMSDVMVDFVRPYPIGKIEQSLLEIPGVKSVEGWGGASAEIWDANDNVVCNLGITAPPQDTQLLAPDFVAGRWLLPGETGAMVVSDTIYKYYPKLEPGDSLIVKLPGQTEKPWKVVGVFRFVSISDDPLAYANLDFIGAQTHLRNQATSYRVVSQLHDPAAQTTLARQINAYLTDRNFSVQNVQTGSRRQELATQGIDILIIFLLIMALLTACVGSIGLTGTMSINVLERTREIGVMRTIGAVDRVIMQSVIIEGLVIGLITWILAILVSFPISYVLLQIIGAAMAGSNLVLSITPLGSLYWLGIVVVLSVVASIMPARNAARLTINEVLAYE